MRNLLNEITFDLHFVQSHTVQPRWYKALKVFILASVLAGYWFFYGPVKTAVFSAVFLFLSFLVHMLYRIKTHKYTQSWLDFVVVEEDHQPRPKSVGVFYYSAVLLNAVIAVIISQSVR